jgi:hypothetical protein
MAAPNLTRVHDPDDVKAELADALRVVAELEPPDDLREAVFQTAASALLLRVADQRPSPLSEQVLRGLAPRE